MRILADTSAWVEYDRETNSPADLRITALLTDGRPPATTETVLMEVTSGARTDEREEQLRALLLTGELLPLNAPTDFRAATTIYRRCRQTGVTPRGLIDCLIAAVALRNGATVLAHDLDFDRMASVIGLAMDESSLRVRN